MIYKNIPGDRIRTGDPSMSTICFKPLQSIALPTELHQAIFSYYQ